MDIVGCSSSFSVSFCEPIVSSPAVDAPNRTNISSLSRRSRGCDSAVLSSIELRSGHSRRFQSNRGTLLGLARSAICIVDLLGRLGSAFIFCAGMRLQPGEKSTNAAGGHGHARICCSVIEVNGVTIRSNCLSAGKDDIPNISRPLIVGFGAKHPGIPSLQADIRPINVEEREPQTIDTAGRRLSHSVIEHQPALCCFNRRRAKTDLVCIPPSTASCLEYYLMVAPML